MKKKIGSRHASNPEKPAAESGAGHRRCQQGALLVQSDPLNPGQRIGPFEVVSLLGRGGMGEVFLASDTRLDRKVAIKVLPKEFAGEPARLSRFEQEAKTLASLDHPNILSIFEVGVHEHAPYLVSQFLEGNTLRRSGYRLRHFWRRNHGRNDRAWPGARHGWLHEPGASPRRRSRSSLGHFRVRLHSIRNALWPPSIQEGDGRSDYERN